MEMTGKNVDAFRQDFEKMMEALEEKYGVTVSLGKITYWEEHFTAKITVTNGTDADTVARNKFDAEVWRYKHLGLTEGMYNRVFVDKDGTRYAIRGFNPRARKWPVEAIRISDGKNWVCNEHFIKEFLNEYYTDVVVYN